MSTVPRDTLWFADVIVYGEIITQQAEKSVRATLLEDTRVNGGKWLIMVVVNHGGRNDL